MNALVLTMLALGGADASMAYAGAGSGGYVTQGGLDYCEDCNDGGHGGRHKHMGSWCGPMPQSCYNPSFGCYPSTRFMHRYPAFHNYYYRSAYNYRHYFDYPWHGGLHEPTSMFSYHTPGENIGQGVPVPTPTASR